jgi:hypothetical protein
MDYVVRKAIDIDLHPNNFNRQDGFCLRKSWKPFICPIKIAGSLPSGVLQMGSPYVT